MNVISRRSLIALLAAALLIVSTVGLSVAYFSDTSQANGAATLQLGAKIIQKSE